MSCAKTPLYNVYINCDLQNGIF
uniref:Uncharacterized protein n=1 Tax=Rhizophora mucronata TaxID=61149 RepID=A0A2P2NJN8_RHIMU